MLDESRFLEIFPSGRKRKSFVICGARRDAFLARCDFFKNGVPNPVAVLELLFILEAFFEALERAGEEFLCTGSANACAVCCAVSRSRSRWFLVVWRNFVIVCEHGRQHSRCKECGGSRGICEHGRQH
jgi:hypothetical protein